MGASLLLERVGGMNFEKYTIAKLEVARIERGISVAELARRIDVDRKRLWYVLNGQRTMRVDEFLKLCVALRIDPSSFITRDMVEGILSACRRQKRKERPAGAGRYRSRNSFWTAGQL